MHNVWRHRLKAHEPVGMGTALKADDLTSPLRGRTTCRRRKPATCLLFTSCFTAFRPSSSTASPNLIGIAFLSIATAPAPGRRRYPLHTDAVPQFITTEGTSTAAVEWVVLMEDDFTATVITIHRPSPVGTMAKPSGPKFLSQYTMVPSTLYVAEGVPPLDPEHPTYHRKTETETQRKHNMHSNLRHKQRHRQWHSLGSTCRTDGLLLFQRSLDEGLGGHTTAGDEPFNWNKSHVSWTGGACGQGCLLEHLPEGLPNACHSRRASVSCGLSSLVPNKGIALLRRLSMNTEHSRLVRTVAFAPFQVTEPNFIMWSTTSPTLKPSTPSHGSRAT